MTNHAVRYAAPARDSRDSMPIGNGELGANVWMEADGDLRCYLSRTDAWSENCRLLKLGRVRLSLDPAPDPGAAFEQTLCPDEGIVHATAGTGDARTEVDVYVDAGQDTLRIDADTAAETACTVSLERWRTRARTVPRDRDDSKEIHSAHGLEGAPAPVVVSPDAVLDTRRDSAGDDRIVWYHRNAGSIHPRNLRLQGLGGVLDERGDDPLDGRTFGGVIAGDGFVREDDEALVSETPARSHTIAVATHTDRTALTGEWIDGALDRATDAGTVDPATTRDRTANWWRDAFERSYIRLSGTEDAETVSRGYALQRHMLLAAGRGRYPIKFNGSLFTADWDIDDEPTSPDYRRWGGHYWWQNTRLAYWPLLMSGDLGCLDVLFRMYREALPLARERTERYFGHEGAYFPETTTFWGTYSEMNYGWDRDGREPGDIDNDYIRHYWQGGLELLRLGIDRYRFAPDAAFLDDTLLPLADDILTFYDEHHPREDGTIRLDPAQSLETYWDAVDPLPDVAGLDAVTEGLLRLPTEEVGSERNERYRRLRDALPAIPTEERDGETVLGPAASYDDSRQNFENPELYAVFPYRRYGIGRPGLDVARATYDRRTETDNFGWAQDPIQAAMLGRADEARRLLVERFGDSYDDARYPAFWGPNHDWVPDQDHGCVGTIALQRMLLQYDGDDLWLFPAWPRDWDAEFKLHAPMETTVEGVYRDGELQSLEVTPADRRSDLSVLDPG